MSTISPARCAGRQVAQGGRVIPAGGTRDPGWDVDAITGYNIIEAEDPDEVEKIAMDSPFIVGMGVYEIRER